MKFAILGGDGRAARLVRLLRNDGHEARPFALERALADCCGTAEEALSGADCAVLPLPCEKDGLVNAPFSAAAYAPAELLRFAAPGTLVCAGKPGTAAAQACRAHALDLVDYAAREEFALMNADLTAEGALAMLLDGPKALRGGEILIAGFGRIGKRLAAKLIPLGARVAVAARSAAARAAAELYGCEAVPLKNAPRAGFDAVLNTIPGTVFDAEALKAFEDAKLIELASPPYGFDLAAAEALGRPVLLASGLPGRTAPESAAEAIQKTIYAIMEERK